MGATYLAQFPVYARDVLGGSVDVFTVLLATFSLGIASGSILCERLSHGRIEIGLVPFRISAGAVDFMPFLVQEVCGQKTKA